MFARVSIAFLLASSALADAPFVSSCLPPPPRNGERWTLEREDCSDDDDIPESCTIQPVWLGAAWGLYLACGDRTLLLEKKHE